jgi:hypothetical protein
MRKRRPPYCLHDRWSVSFAQPASLISRLSVSLSLSFPLFLSLRLSPSWPNLRREWPRGAERWRPLGERGWKSEREQPSLLSPAARWIAETLASTAHRGIRRTSETLLAFLPAARVAPSGVHGGVERVADACVSPSGRHEKGVRGGCVSLATRASLFFHPPVRTKKRRLHSPTVVAAAAGHARASPIHKTLAGRVLLSFPQEKREREGISLSFFPFSFSSPPFSGYFRPRSSTSTIPPPCGDLCSSDDVGGRR